VEKAIFYEFHELKKIQNSWVFDEF